MRTVTISVATSLRSLQHCRKETIAAVPVRKRSHESISGDQIESSIWVDQSEARTALQEAADQLFILFAFNRASRIHKSAAGRNHLRAALQECELKLNQAREVVGGEPPLYLGIAPQRPGARARRINQNAIEFGRAFGERKRSRRVQHERIYR